MSVLIYVNFMPWLEVSNSITLGNITFWNFSRESEERIKDTKLRKRLARHFKSYRNSSGSLNSITICSFEGKTFYENLNEKEFNHLREVITAIAFASTIQKIESRIQNSQKHYVPPSMNAFDLMSRRLEFSSKHYSHVSLSLMDLGMTEGNIFFQKPLAARGDISLGIKWLKYLNAYLNLNDSSMLRNRISRSLEFFRLAQAQDDLKDSSLETAFLTRTVLLSTAFESLLNFPFQGKADFFAEYLNQRFSLKNSRKSSRKIRKNKPKVQYSVIAWWAYNFYKLRNSIVHGNNVNFERLKFKKGLWFSQMDVACIVFADCLEEIVLSKKILKTKRRVDEFMENRGVKNWKKHHKVLGWIKE